LQKIKALKDNAETFASAAGIKLAEVQTYYISKSRRYKYMRVFYAKVEPEKVGADVFTFSNSDWTMFKWLTD
jgi:hypothetical protein